MLTRLKSLFTSRPDALDEKAFTVRIVKALSARHPDISVSVVRPLELLIKSADVPPFTENLEDVYATYSQEPGQLAALKTLRVEAISSRLTLKAAQPVGREHLIPVVRRDAAEAPAFIVHRPLTDGLMTVLVFETEAGQVDVTVADLETLDLSESHAFATALENLELKADDLSIEHLDHGLWVIAGTKTPASSMLLASEFWRTKGFSECKALVAYAPDSNQLVVVDLDFEEAVATAPTLAEELHNDAVSPLTLEPMVIKDETTAVDEPAPIVETAVAPEIVEQPLDQAAPVVSSDAHAIAEVEPSADDAQDPTELVDRIVAVILPAAEAARDGWMSRSITSNLAAALAFDQTGNLVPLTMQDAQRLNADLDDLFELAIENVGLRVADLEVKEIESGVHLVVCHDIAPGAALFCKPLWFEGAFAQHLNLAAYLLPAHGLLVFDPTDRSTEQTVNEVLEHFADESGDAKRAPFVNVKHDGSLVDLANQYEPEPLPTFSAPKRFGRASR